MEEKLLALQASLFLAQKGQMILHLAKPSSLGTAVGSRLLRQQIQPQTERPAYFLAFRLGCFEKIALPAPCQAAEEKPFGLLRLEALRPLMPRHSFPSGLEDEEHYLEEPQRECAQRHYELEHCFLLGTAVQKRSVSAEMLQMLIAPQEWRNAVGSVHLE